MNKLCLAALVFLGATSAHAAPDTVPVPAGCFEMGDGSATDDPKHKVCVEAFDLDRTEVTNRAWDACVAAGKCVDLKPFRASLKGGPWDGAEQPVVLVTWSDAAGFCKWAGKRLPTEAEWEYAARGSDGRKYPWGNDKPDCSRANYASLPAYMTCKPAYCAQVTACAGKNPAHPAPVGSYPSGASPFGALDMAGNVAEWVDDWYDVEAYFNPNGAPSDDARVWKVDRGGYWFGPAEFLEGADRDRGKPDSRNEGVGFRCARDAKRR